MSSKLREHIYKTSRSGNNSHGSLTLRLETRTWLSRRDVTVTSQAGAGCQRGGAGLCRRRTAAPRQHCSHRRQPGEGGGQTGCCAGSGVEDGRPVVTEIGATD